MVVLKTNHGDIKLELDTENAPDDGPRNFLTYVRDGTTTIRCSTASSTAS
jgi:cyclophilin family peptidyl-prolyl cis-trans isomerase